MTDDQCDYESGPFCRHWGDPSDCDVECECPAWVEPEEGFDVDHV